MKSIADEFNRIYEEIMNTKTYINGNIITSSCLASSIYEHEYLLNSNINLLTTSIHHNIYSTPIFIERCTVCCDGYEKIYYTYTRNFHELLSSLFQPKKRKLDMIESEESETKRRKISSTIDNECKKRKIVVLSDKWRPKKVRV